MAAYASRFGLKPVSKLFQDADMASLKTMKAVAALRPRGELSGQLVVHSSSVVFVPPKPFQEKEHSKGHKSTTIRMRLSDTIHDVIRDGIIFSAYLDNTDIVIEDVLVWAGKHVFPLSFEERWNYVGNFVKAWQPDDVLQGCSIRFAEYRSLLEIQEPDERQVLEFVPLAPNTKRLVWIPVAEAAKPTVWIARRETLVGPDIFSLWCAKTGEKQGMGLVRTLAVSKVLRQHPVDEFRVNATWNKMFERWEIVGIA